jgi:two-component system, response regulator PdtaR
MSRIFIVEDELLIAEDLAQTLQGLGYEVAGMAQTGLAAVMDVEKLEPDLVLMDIKLAGRLDGIQATAALRKRGAVPVVYLTSHSDDATLARAKQTGADGYLIKPFNERELRTAIEVALSKHQLEQKVVSRRARVLLIDDEEIVGRTIQRLLDDKHDVTRETDPRKALARVAGGERFDVVLCDLSMPHMNGRDVFEQVFALDPGLARRIVFLTGGIGSDELEDFLERSSNLVLHKPFSVEKLLAGIAGQLR